MFFFWVLRVFFAIFSNFENVLIKKLFNFKIHSNLNFVLI
jgi:hypothetical protein